MAISTYLSTTTLNVNRLNVLIKRHTVAEWVTKEDPPQLVWLIWLGIILQTNSLLVRFQVRAHHMPGLHVWKVANQCLSLSVSLPHLLPSFPSL